MGRVLCGWVWLFVACWGNRRFCSRALGRAYGGERPALYSWGAGAEQGKSGVHTHPDADRPGSLGTLVPMLGEGWGTSEGEVQPGEQFPPRL